MKTLGQFAGTALAMVLGLAPATSAQDAGPKDVHKIYTRNSVFKLPVQIDEKDRSELSGLKLFVKALPGTWECRESAPATQKEFSFRAPRDGEYWFSFATVDKLGVVTPTTPDKEPPGLMVVVDTQAPEVSVRPHPSNSGPGYLQCKLSDANPDYRSIKIEYENNSTNNRTWIALEPVVGMTGAFEVPNPAILTGKLRVHAADLAGNVVEREIDLSEFQTPTIVQTVATADSVTANKPTVPLPASPAASPAAMVSSSAPIALPPDIMTAAPLQPVSAGPIQPIALPNPIKDVAAPTQTCTKPNSSKTIAAINSLRCKFAIWVDGSSNGSWIEIWATADSGKSWSMVGENRNRTTLIAVEFPCDGTYGYSFVVKSVVGGDQPPSVGDTPDGWIEIDTTKPVAEVLSVALGTGEDSGNLLVTWLARDRNFGASPISLYYAPQATGPWQPIAEKIANSGSHRWLLPRNLGGRVYVRMTATDRAGNVSICDFPTPVQFETTRPKVKLLSVTPAAKE